MGWIILIGIAVLIFMGIYIQNRQRAAEREAHLNTLLLCPLCDSLQRRRDLKQEYWWSENTLICAQCFVQYALCPKCKRFCPKSQLAPFWHIDSIRPNSSTSHNSYRSTSDTSLYCPPCYSTVTADEKQIIAAYASNPDSHLLRHEYGKTFHWKTFRESIIKGRSNVCESCGYSPHYRKKSRYFITMHIHHFHYRSIGKESPSDVQLLCEICHEQKHPDRMRIGPRGGRYVWRNGKKTYV